ncbi:hypothetical protein MSM1_20565 [Mycobacterium sp. SM1]|uniref:hypothetical protein n=1 Tax=Mycobacterium sp. SM1 TaxID=2816243 RepID=UPI001BCD3266|nr:hypothetical protein [Mycobacterium sp. SM1]MBS4730608.1 hypothetical protein [Mycobacterium sp. SM1]
MTFINTDRMFTVTEAKPRLHELVADAHQGRTYHIVKGSEVVAHLVPPTARIIDEEPLMAILATALVERETDYVANEIARGTEFYGHAGDHAGRFFAWAWRTDKHLFMKYLAQYHEMLSQKLHRQLDAADLMDLLDTAMTVRLVDSEVNAARRYALSHAPDYFYYKIP